MIYQNFAFIYDELMKHAPYDQWVTMTKEILTKYGSHVDTIIDLGCGTGEITIQLQKENYNIYGIDFSSDMLAIAHEKALKNNVDIQWIKQDIVKLEGFENIDMAVSFCDVFNYIKTKAELLEAFKRIYKSLNETGLFLFDIHNETYVKNELIGHSFIQNEREIAYIWDCYSEKEGELIHDLSFFVQEKEDYYVRFDETHIQQVYPVETYKNLLEEANFTILNIYADFSLKMNINLADAKRIFILAEKRAK